jgi:virulence-associated protein VagC
MNTKLTKVFKNGRSHAVRIPKKWIGEAKEVVMEKSKEGILIRPKRKNLSELSKIFIADPINIERHPQTRTSPKEI